MRQDEVDLQNYTFDRYIDINRWSSYYKQINEISKTGCRSVLVIGVGDGIVPYILKTHIVQNGEVHTFDFDEALYPDIIGDLREISKLVNRKYECVVCCQVLEHLEWNSFASIINQIREICTDTCIISLPMSSYNFRIMINFPKLHNKFILRARIDRFWKKETSFFGTQHFWEVGIKDRGLKKIRKIFSERFIVKECRPYDFNPKHLFMVLKVK